MVPPAQRSSLLFRRFTVDAEIPFRRYSRGALPGPARPGCGRCRWPEGSTPGVVSARAQKKADADKDGTLDKAEFESIATYHFQKADKDQKGTLDAKEMKSYQGKTLAKLLGL